MRNFTVTTEQEGKRIDIALVTLIDAYSRSTVQRLIRKGLVSINGHVAKKGNRVREGDTISVRELPLEKYRFQATNIPLNILYEDEDLLVVDKPAGLLIHPTAREQEYTLVNALLHHCGDRLSGIGGEKRPGIIHRLDKDTSGILIVAKHDDSHKDMAKQIQERKVEKYYLALVNGIMDSLKGSIDAPLLKTQVRGKNKVIVSPSRIAKNSLTHFEVRETFDGKWSLLNVQIITGRMHQIRVHLGAIRHPVIGDKVYGNKKVNSYFKKLGLNRQFLHAHCIKFRHPRTNKWMSFEASLPPDLQSVLHTISTLHSE